MLNGIDISAYQSTLNVAKVSGDFAIIKATEGQSYINPYLHQQVEQARKSGKLIGLYHFSRAGSPVGEASFFLRVCKPYLSFAILVLDDEGFAVTAGGSSWAKNFLDCVASKTGCKPLLYTGLSDENRINWRCVAKDYKLWVAQYNDMLPYYGYRIRGMYGHLRNWDWRNLAMFQYSATGRLAGYDGDLDLDVYYGKREDWLKHTSNDTGDDEEMTWHPLCDALSQGVFMVTKKSGATLWAGPDNYKKVDAKKLKYGTSWLISGVKNGFVRVAKTKDGEEWVDSRAGVVKFNPVYSNHNIHAQIIIKGPAKLHTKPHDSGYGHELPINSKYAVTGIVDAVDRGVDYWYWSLKTKSGKTVYINSKKTKVIL